MSTIFVSYSSEDRTLVKEAFVGLITAVGYECWIDERSIRPSEYWKPSIESGLEGADWFLLVVSRTAAASDFVKIETRWALDNLSNRLILVLVDDTNPTDIDPRLSEVQCLDYKKEPLRAVEGLVKLLVDAKHGGYGRDLSGNWLSAVQPVYYPSTAWHVQRVEAVRTPDGYRITTLEEPGKLQWRFDAKFFGSVFLAGPWQSTRPGSQSQGYMTLQVARNGAYMCGHDYAMPLQEARAHFGVLLLAKTHEMLDNAWEAMRSAQRPMRPLTELHEFPSAPEH
jgi:hypothetical protein